MSQYIFLVVSTLILSTQCNSIKKGAPTDKAHPKVAQKGTYPVSEYTKQNKLENYETAIFAGGCFWCTEAAFERINGVVDVISGYAGGHVEYPTYSAVGRGKTGHAEAIYIYYDPSIIDYKTLLSVFFVAHDPTTLNRQGPDSGPAYRSAIYYLSNTDKEAIDKEINKVNKSGYYNDKVVTEVKPFKEFWVAEEYHQNFYELNPKQGYVVNVSRPKVIKVKKAFPDLIKKKYRN